MEVIYGASPEFSLSNLDENVHPEGHVYVEDREAQIFLREIIASSREEEDLILRIDIIPVGASNVVHIMSDLAARGKLPTKSIAVSDGDQRTADCLSLPGERAPERVVFEGLRNAEWPNLSERFGVEAVRLLTYLEDAMLDPEPHNWTEKVGNRVIKSKTTVWEILTNQWCKSCLKTEDRDYLISRIKEKILSE
jgi:hypothetical protein